jgi:3-dehydroquinate synthase
MSDTAVSDSAMSDTERLRVELGTRAYDIVVGRGVLAGAGAALRQVIRRRHAIIVTDENVAPLHLPRLVASLDAADIAHDTITLPPGEQTKSFATYGALCERILALGIERATPLVALGGGVIGDLTGFAAATLLRGLDYVQVPTTLLAQVDSSVGGKTAIDTMHGKNLVGAFHQPVLVLADIDVLATLPRRELLAGYAEIAKYGAISDAPFFAWLEAHGAALVAGDPAARRQAVRQSCAAKAAIVGVDEKESGARALLNFGHTFAHALETATGYGDALLHGEAVALGMRLAADLSAELGLCPAPAAQRLRRHLVSVGLPTEISEIAGGRSFRAADLVAHMRLDKKVQDGRITLILLRGLGEAFVSRSVAADIIEAFLAREIAGLASRSPAA